MGVMRDLFGPSKEEIWTQFANEIGGRFIGSAWHGDKVEAKHGEWIVTLDWYSVYGGRFGGSVTYTRLRAPYINPDGFRFLVYPSNIFAEVAKCFGLQDITVGYPKFDRAFIIKGNDEQKLKRLFANAKIRELIPTQMGVNFRVLDDESKLWSARGFPPNVDELYFKTADLIKNVDELKLLYELFSETLDELCRIGSAYKDAPGIKL
jgi:hypothetical protein